MIDVGAVPFDEMALTAAPAPELLRRIRKALGLSQGELARALGFSNERVISRWESEEDGPAFPPTPLAWAAIKYLAALMCIAKQMPTWPREAIALPDRILILLSKENSDAG